MKQVVVLSGKGGTGKTTVTASIGHLASMEGSVLFVDADVDASNLELLLSPKLQTKESCHAGATARIDAARCNGCGECAEVCRFDAVTQGDGYSVDAVACEGCRACFYACPCDAIVMESVKAGEVYRSETAFGPLFHARLLPGRENSGKLVTAVRRAAAECSRERPVDLILIDGPPGIGCPVIAASTGADLALIVTEPTLSAIHDLERALQTASHFGIPAVVCINKFDLNERRTEEIEEACREREVDVIGWIPFDLGAQRAVVARVPVTTCAEGGLGLALRRLYGELGTLSILQET